MTLRRAAQSAKLDSEIAIALEAVPTTVRADHPLVSSFAAAFDADDPGLLRESISGLTDPHWWKQKVSRWRGAATDAHIVGENEVWLCAGGLRADGEARDFYAVFKESLSSEGAAKFLPDAADRRLQTVEEKVARRDAWLEQVRLSVLICLHECSASGEPRSLHIPGPSPAKVQDPITHLVFDVTRVEGEGDELVEVMVTVKDLDHSRINLAEIALDAARSVIEPVADAWRVLPGPGTDQIWSTLASSEAMRHALSAVENGSVPEHLRETTLLLGVQAHYTPRDAIVDASVEGEAIRGLCGTWFVPTSNPDELPVCPSCRMVHDRLPA